MTARAQGGVKSARRALQVIEYVARRRDGATFVEIARDLGLPNSSLHGLLATLVDMRWLLLDPAQRRYLVGVRPWEVGQAFLPSRELVVRARRYLRAANDELGETIQMAILDDLDVVYIDKVEGTHPLRLVSEVGIRLPAYVTGIGKALLAALPDDELQERFAGVELEGYTSRTITSGDRLLEVLRAVREQGYAEDDGEYTTGVFCTAVPIRDAAGRTVAAMSCAVPTSRIETGELDTATVREVLVRHADGIRDALGPDVPRLDEESTR
ncbi:IclR family transcriptional regulator [Actinotalea caeni]|uniref:IclR family transcriptional regulator n=1 Tax=Actinotalea caeni TaxID=1348467 RepID=UPI0012E21FB4|nr:IclR family transcriptional regulator [Actinotalea caeni]